MRCKSIAKTKQLLDLEALTTTTTLTKTIERLTTGNAIAPLPLPTLITTNNDRQLQTKVITASNLIQKP